MSKISAAFITYEFSPEQIKKMIATELGVDYNNTQIQFIVNNVAQDVDKICMNVDNRCQVITT
jgi:hypothetical protein